MTGHPSEIDAHSATLSGERCTGGVVVTAYPANPSEARYGRLNDRRP